MIRKSAAGTVLFLLAALLPRLTFGWAVKPPPPPPPEATVEDKINHFTDQLEEIEINLRRLERYYGTGFESFGGRVIAYQIFTGQMALNEGRFTDAAQALGSVALDDRYAGQPGLAQARALYAQALIHSDMPRTAKQIALLVVQDKNASIYGADGLSAYVSACVRLNDTPCLVQILPRVEWSLKYMNLQGDRMDELRYEYGRALVVLKRHEEAVAQLKMVPLESRWWPRARYLIGAAHALRKDYGPALGELLKVADFRVAYKRKEMFNQAGEWLERKAPAPPSRDDGEDDREDTGGGLKMGGGGDIPAPQSAGAKGKSSAGAPLPKEALKMTGLEYWPEPDMSDMEANYLAGARKNPEMRFVTEVAEQANLTRGRIHQALGNFRNAWDAYSMIPPDSPNYLQASFETLWLLVDFELFDDALTALDGYIKLAPGYAVSGTTPFIRGAILARAERVDEVESWYARVREEYASLKRDLDDAAVREGSFANFMMSTYNDTAKSGTAVTEALPKGIGLVPGARPLIGAAAQAHALSIERDEMDKLRLQIEEIEKLLQESVKGEFFEGLNQGKADCARARLGLDALAKEIGKALAEAEDQLARAGEDDDRAPAPEDIKELKLLLRDVNNAKGMVDNLERLIDDKVSRLKSNVANELEKQKKFLTVIAAEADAHEASLKKLAGDISTFGEQNLDVWLAAMVVRAYKGPAEAAWSRFLHIRDALDTLAREHKANLESMESSWTDMQAGLLDDDGPRLTDFIRLLGYAIAGERKADAIPDFLRELIPSLGGMKMGDEGAPPEDDGGSLKMGK
ncbi:MAG: hypothetical protein GMKNLPBB_02396 [Myxococcota bacterium]|nr:hypothetical protein [Myxococcota bacterium]